MLKTPFHLLTAVAIATIWELPSEAIGQVGACCSSFGICLQLDAVTCSSQGSDFLGGPCALNLCRGACCTPNGDCSLNLPRVACEFNGGTFLGYGSNCDGVQCPVLPNGACCGVTFCQVGWTPQACPEIYAGDDSTCQDCPGACCLKDNSCISSTRGACESTEGAEFAGNLTTCPPEGCGDGACCLQGRSAPPTCVVVSNEDACTMQGGVFAGPGIPCGEEGKCPPAPFCGDGNCEQDQLPMGGSREDCASCPQDCRCDQGPKCTDGMCNRFGQCDYIPFDERCSDGNACTEDICDPESGCSNGPDDCNDDNPCTMDSCDPHVGCDNSAMAGCGACCFPDHCMTVANGFSGCNSLGGVYQGDGTACEAPGDICPGACCFADGTCEMRRPAGCEEEAGDFQGEFTTCAETNCPVLGACCLFFADERCRHTSREDCPVGFSAEFLGEGTRCPVNLPANGHCRCMTNSDCDDENPCNGRETCVDGSCRAVSRSIVGGPTCGNGDFDGNGNVDHADVALLIPCLKKSGPGAATTPACAAGDRNGDTFIDLHDFWYLQRRPFVCNVQQCEAPVAGHCQQRCLGDEICDGLGNCVPD